jgi:predicted DNA-binding transcriptional regulator AlpA
VSEQPPTLTLGLAPEDVAHLPAEALPGLLVMLAALQTAVGARIMSASVPSGEKGKLLTAEEVGQRLGMSPREVYRRCDRWPFMRRLGPKTLRFDAAGLALYLARKAEP